MSKYFITMLGMYQESTVRDISFLLIPMISESNLKFHYTDHSIVYHFESHWDLQTIHSYCKKSFGGVSDVIIISDATSTEVDMNEVMLKQLLDLETNTEDSTMMIPITRQFNGDDLLAQDLTQEDDDEEDDDDLFMGLKNPKPKVPTLDEILDKICDRGIDSLNDNEKFILSKHSN